MNKILVDEKFCHHSAQIDRVKFYSLIPKSISLSFSTGEIVSQWGEWSSCSRECKRGKQTRTRICYDRTLFDEEENFCGGEPLKEEQECLVREDCQGSGYYLAEVGQSCDEFCASKGKEQHDE